MLTELPRRDVVLWGVGHTNAHVLRMWRMQPIPNARLTCVSDFSVATYSGMLPGVLAGQYSAERMQIDLVRLCAAAGARLVVGRPTGLNLTEQRLLLDDRVPIPFDVLSIGIGSQPTLAYVESLDESVVLIKPMQTFLDRLYARVLAVGTRNCLKFAVVGAGIGGVEVTLCLPGRLRGWLGQQPFEITLINATDRVPGAVASRTERAIRRELESRGVRMIAERRVTRVADGAVQLSDGQVVAADVVIWATSAIGSPMLAQLGLPTDERGFLLIRPTLQTVGHDAIFAVGDTGSLASGPTPKAGVYAVRQGITLWDNIGLVLRGEPLREFQPQPKFLKLVNLGDGRAVGEWHGFTLSGQWVWRWKDWIDSRFMDKYQNFEPAGMSSVVDQLTPPPMRCLGCGGKVSGSVLSRVLQRLDIPPHPAVELGLAAPDDAAIIRLPAGRAINATVDFFTAPFDDPYTVGRIAALHSASDCFATGAAPIAALASVTIPVGSARQQEQLLFELLSGALRELKEMGATLVGGHTIEGPNTTIGFTMLAEQRDPPRTKASLKPGDVLILTKPLGTGVLLAAHQQARCRADWFESLLQSMLQSNQLVAKLCDDFQVTALTDVTGFGLAGHLLEMLQGSGVAAELSLAKCRLLPGVEELLSSGLESTLAPANRDAEADIAADESVRDSARYAALFDPQTAGGLLLGIEESVADQLIKRFVESDISAVAIGRIRTATIGEPRIRVS